MTPKKAIAVFDSGYGGLSILKHLLHLFPNYNFIYFGDNARAPYGTRSYDVVYNYTLQATKSLFNMGAPLVILACNTASAKALRTIQQIDLPKINPQNRVLGVIRPSIEILPEITKTNHIGILGTPGTIQSNSYPLEIHKINPDITVFQHACPMWVPLIENNEYQSKGALYFIQKDIQALLSQSPKIDSIVLGCTHYPILLPIIERELPKTIKIIEQGSIVAQSLKDYLKRHPEMDERIEKKGQVHFFTSEEPKKFEQLAFLFLNKKIKAQRLNLPD